MEGAEGKKEACCNIIIFPSHLYFINIISHLVRCLCFLLLLPIYNINPIIKTTTHNGNENRFLPDEQYGIALDNLVKGCTDILLLHPDGKRIFLGKRCVQREYYIYVVFFFVIICHNRMNDIYCGCIFIIYYSRLSCCAFHWKLFYPQHHCSYTPAHNIMHTRFYTISSSTRLVVYGWTNLSW